jgi:hypothetical protein
LPALAPATMSSLKPQSLTTRARHGPAQCVQSTTVEISALVFAVLESTRQGRCGAAGFGLSQPGAVSAGQAGPLPDPCPCAHLAPERLVEDLTQGNERLRRQISLRYATSGTAVELRLKWSSPMARMEALNLCLQAVTQPR